MRRWKIENVGSASRIDYYVSDVNLERYTGLFILIYPYLIY